MSTLQKKGNYYHAAFRSESGKTITLTTGQTTKEAARQAVKDAGIDQLEAAAATGRLTNEAIGRIKTGGKLTMESASVHYLKACRANGKSEQTIERERGTFARFLKQTRLGAVPPTAVTEEQIRTWVNDEESESKLGSRLINLTTVRTFFKFCVFRGWTCANPARNVRVNRNLLSHEQKERKQKTPFTKTEFTQMLHATAEDGAQAGLFWHFAILLGWETGARLADISTAEWAQFDEAGHFICHTRKTGARIALPISEKMQELVASLPATNRYHLFPQERATVLDVKRRAALSVQFSRLLGRLEIGGRSFHSLRHTFVERMRQHGSTWEEIAEAIGHACTETTKGYASKKVGGKKRSATAEPKRHE